MSRYLRQSLFVALFLSVLFAAGSLPARSVDSHADIGLPLTQTYDPDDFNAHVQNWVVRQARDGRILVGNGNGLLVWDGERWQRYSTPNQSRIRDLLEWHDGRVYVGTVNDIGYYAPDERGRLEYHSLVDPESPELRAFGEIWSVAASGDQLLFNSSKRLLRFDGEALQVVAGVEAGANRVFSVDGGFLLFPERGPAYRIPAQPGGEIQRLVVPGLPEQRKVRDILPAADGSRLIVTSGQGIFRWNERGAELLIGPEIFGEEVDIYTGFRASDGYYYFGSRRHGLFVFSPELEPLRRYGRAEGTGLDTVLDISEDHQGGIWFSGLPGVSRIIPPHHYSHYGTREQNIGFPDLQDWRGRPLLAAFSIYTLQAATKPFSAPRFVALDGWNHNSNFVLDLGERALVAATGGVFELAVGAEDALLPIPGKPPLLEVMFANHLALEPGSITDGPVVYAATSAGLYRLGYSAGLWQTKKVEGIDEPLLYLTFDPQGNLWAGTSNQRLFFLPRVPGGLGEPVLYGARNGLGSNNVYPLVAAGKLYFGTGNGLYDFIPDREPEFQPAPGFPEIFHTPEKDFFRWLVDRAGNFWYRIGNHTGVAWRQPDGSYLADESISQPLPFRSASGFFEARDGGIWIAQADGGVYRIGTGLLQAPGAAVPLPGRLAITGITRLDDSEVLYGGYGPVRIGELASEVASIRIHYALGDYSLSGKTLYRSRLSGSEQWSEWSRETWRDFTRLRGGDYTFELEARDGWGRVQRLADFRFTVIPPWYLGRQALAAYLVLLLLALGAAVFLGQRLRNARLEERNLALQEIVEERTAEVRARVEELKQQQELKDRFFANVSHEFRTPLTLTIEPLEEVLREHGGQLDDQARGLAEVALRNARKMLGLIGEVLDINRLESGSLRLLVAEHDLAELIRRIAGRFRPWLQKQSQQLELIGAEDPVLLWYDPDQMDRIIGNLLSNAIKYSGRGSRIEVRLTATDEQVEVRVRDNGPGIPPDQREKVFERYYQGESAADNVWPGTGIGLALVRELAALHSASVELEDTPQGASFCLRLQRGQGHFAPEVLAPDGIPQAEWRPADAAAAPVQAQTGRGDDITTVLVIDDNDELRQFLANRLAGRYRVLQAEDGREGLALARAELPDLIISDVMMPEMDGYALARELKQDPATRTIPLILLTARSTKRDTVTGLEAGADDYLTKPFDTSELIARVAGLIASRRLLRVAAMEEFQSGVEAGREQQDPFLRRLDELILANLDDSALNVESLAGMLHMDRSSLYRKCQKATAMSPVAYLRKTRMRVAARLLRKPGISVSEVAYATGFESISYFSRVFKQEFEISPSGYAGRSSVA